MKKCIHSREKGSWWSNKRNSLIKGEKFKSSFRTYIVAKPHEKMRNMLKARLRYTKKHSLKLLQKEIQSRIIGSNSTEKLILLMQSTTVRASEKTIMFIKSRSKANFKDHLMARASANGGEESMFSHLVAEMIVFPSFPINTQAITIIPSEKHPHGLKCDPFENSKPRQMPSISFWIWE